MYLTILIIRDKGKNPCRIRLSSTNFFKEPPRPSIHVTDNRGCRQAEMTSIGLLSAPFGGKPFIRLGKMLRYIARRIRLFHFTGAGAHRDLVESNEVYREIYYSQYPKDGGDAAEEGAK